jgi:flagellar hook assembly protein FlgD
VPFTTSSLHPPLTPLSPNPFSPNGDKSKDTTAATFGVPGTSQTAYLTVYNSAGVLVYAKTKLGTYAKGNHTITWSGKSNNGATIGNGTYTLVIETTEAGSLFFGSGIRTVVVDDTAPTLSTVLGNGTTFYPYVDGYKDSFVPSTVISEPTTLSLVITTTSGKAVRTVTLAKTAGTHTLSWGGHYASGSAVPAGKYDWHFTAVDAAGNVKHSSTYTVTISSKKLVSKSAKVVHNGNGYSYIVGNANGEQGCLGYDNTVNSGQKYTHGADFFDECDNDGGDNDQYVGATYKFAVPSTSVYTSLSLSVTGSTFTNSATLFGGFDLVHSADGSPSDYQSYPSNKGSLPTSSSTKTYSLGTVSPSHLVSSSHDVYAEFDMTNQDGQEVSDFDVEYFTLTVNYKVLD